MPTTQQLIRALIAPVLLATAASAQPIATRLVIQDPHVNSPVFVTAAPGDTERLFVVNQIGPDETPNDVAVGIFSLPCTEYLGRFVSIPNVVASPGSETGLLGMAFHPNYTASSNGKVYFYYTTYVDNGKTFATVLEVYTRDPQNPNRLLTPGSIILTIPKPSFSHNGGWMKFGPDGYLYFSCGDGGNIGDSGPGHIEPTGNAQSLETLMGKILRIDVNGNNGPNGLYGIPPTNPYANSSNPDVRKEIWAYGLRNPWRNDIDPLTGDLYIADVGQDTYEEINIQPGDIAGSQGGRNYGWRCFEADAYFNGNNGTCPDYDTQLSPFLLKYAHVFIPTSPPTNRTGCAVTGGVVYRGSEIPFLTGTYFFADYCENWAYSLRANALTNTFTDFTDRTDEIFKATGLSNIVSFGRDAAGEIYICAQGGTSGPGVYKIVPPDDIGPVDCACPGDANKDGARDTLDLLVILQHFGLNVPPGTPGDLDGNGQVNTHDLIRLFQFYGTSCR